MAEGSEIERKFLVSDAPDDLESYPAESIEQGYIVVEGSAEVRVRRRIPNPGAGAAPGGRAGPREPGGRADSREPGWRAQLTIKSGAGRVRVEEEFDLDERRFDSLWRLSEGRRVAKTRYRLPTEGGLTIELDVYTGELSGLIVAEVEFASEDASDEFQPVAWFGRELTDDHRYANRSLAVDGLPAP